MIRARIMPHPDCPYRATLHVDLYKQSRRDDEYSSTLITAGLDTEDCGVCRALFASEALKRGVMRDVARIAQRDAIPGEPCGRWLDGFGSLAPGCESPVNHLAYALRVKE